MTKAKWTGVFPALATPFTSEGKIDKAQQAALVELLLSEGVHGFIVGGSTGEYYSMSLEEREELFRDVHAVVAGRGTLIAGTSSTNHAETLHLTRVAKDIGYDGVMVLPPVYCLPTPAEIVKVFEEIAAIGLPIMVYNNPARVGVALPTGLTEKLAAIPGVAAYKESARDLYAVAELCYATRDRLAIFAGLEPYGAAIMSRGGAGIVSTISNVVGRQVVDYYNAIRAGDAAEAAKNQRVIDEMYHLLGRSGLANFSFVKCAMAALGRPGGAVRAPHIMGDDAKIAEIGKEVRAIYARAGIELPQA